MATAKKTAKPAAKSASTEVAVRKPSSGGLVDMKAQIAAQIAAIGDRTQAGGGNAIRLTQDRRFVLPDGTKTEGPIQAVIVDFVAANFYFDRDFNKDDVTPPACYALDTNPKALAPRDNSPDKQADSCEGCPMNQWDSGKNGGKACQNARVLAILQPDADAETPMWTLKVSPTAVKGFDAYVRSLGRMGAVPATVVTTIAMNPDSEYASLVFEDPTPNENAAVHFARQKEAQDMLLEDRDTSAWKPVQAPTRKAASKTARR